MAGVMSTNPWARKPWAEGSNPTKLGAMHWPVGDWAMGAQMTNAAERIRWTAAGVPVAGPRVLPEETPIALVHDGSTTAVMMATPGDLEDFGVGFSLSEGIVRAADEIRDLEISTSDLGVEVRLWLTAERTHELAARRRRLAGPTGCGLCGLESLEEVRRLLPPIADGLTVRPEELLEAMASLEAAQTMGKLTHAVHAAALWRRGGAVVLREDVGRHNALDKLVGAVARAGAAGTGVLALTSRVSIEMIQKAAVLGEPIVCAMSAPTGLAVRMADAAGLTLVGIARADGFEVFTHPERVRLS
jgi:FdhD protein